MMEFPLLTSIVYEREFIHKWQFVQIDDDNRLYYRIGTGEHPGFTFYSVEWTGCAGDHREDHWNLESVEVQCGIHGLAYWDGVRHLYWGHDDTNNYGYHYYADIKQEVAVLLALRGLEEKYCNLS